MSNSGGIYELNDFIVRSYLQQQKDGVLITPTEIAKRQCYTPRLNMDVSGSSSSRNADHVKALAGQVQLDQDVVEFSDSKI